LLADDLAEQSIPFRHQLEIVDMFLQLELVVDRPLGHAQPGEQFNRIVGFGQVIVGAGIQAGGEIVLGRLGREHDHVGPDLEAGGANPRADFGAVHAGHHPIENGHARRFRGEHRFQRAGSIHRGDHLVIRFLQKGGQHLSAHGIVVGDKYLGVGFDKVGGKHRVAQGSTR
jgi:hypothetical protein